MSRLDNAITAFCESWLNQSPSDPLIPINPPSLNRNERGEVVSRYTHYTPSGDRVDIRVYNTLGVEVGNEFDVDWKTLTFYVGLYSDYGNGLNTKLIVPIKDNYSLAGDDYKSYEGRDCLVINLPNSGGSYKSYSGTYYVTPFDELKIRGLSDTQENAQNVFPNKVDVDFAKIVIHKAGDLSAVKAEAWLFPLDGRLYRHV